tara:strand:- start:5201 stop:6019 length:819 start_codon:yes stop_codon:yes gene_type:complete
MENTNYIFEENDNKLMGTRVKQNPVIHIEDKYLRDRVNGNTKTTKNTMRERANNLLGDDTGNVISDKAIKIIQNRNYAREQTLKNDFYRFIMQVAGLATEPIAKLWNEKKEKDERPLISGGINSLSVEASGALQTNYTNVNGPNENQDLINKELREKGDLIASAEVAGQFLLTPSAYAHLMEAWEMIRHRCKTNVSLDRLVSPEFSTYFARLVALRIQISRFLSGRYYTVASNYKRLLNQQEMLIQGFFKSKFNSPQVGFQPNRHSYLQALQ